MRQTAACWPRSLATERRPDLPGATQLHRLMADPAAEWMSGLLPLSGWAEQPGAAWRRAAARPGCASTLLRSHRNRRRWGAATPGLPWPREGCGAPGDVSLRLCSGGGEASTEVAPSKLRTSAEPGWCGRVRYRARGTALQPSLAQRAGGAGRGCRMRLDGRGLGCATAGHGRSSSGAETRVFTMNGWRKAEAAGRPEAACHRELCFAVADLWGKRLVALQNPRTSSASEIIWASFARSPQLAGGAAPRAGSALPPAERATDLGEWEESAGSLAW